MHSRLMRKRTEEPKTFSLFFPCCNIILVALHRRSQGQFTNTAFNNRVLFFVAAKKHMDSLNDCAHVISSREKLFSCALTSFFLLGPLKQPRTLIRSENSFILEAINHHFFPFFFSTKRTFFLLIQGPRKERDLKFKAKKKDTCRALYRYSRRTFLSLGTRLGAVIRTYDRKKDFFSTLLIQQKKVALNLSPGCVERKRNLFSQSVPFLFLNKGTLK